MGDLLGHAVRFGVAARSWRRRRYRDDTVASMRPAKHADGRSPLGGGIFPPSCSRTRCADSTSPATTIRPAMARMATLVDRAQEVGIEAIVISPRLGDFNEDLSRLLGIDALRAATGCRSRHRTSPLHGAGGPSRNGSERRFAGVVATGVGGRGFPSASERTHAHGLLRRAIEAASGPGPANLVGRLFSVGGGAAFTSRDKIVGPFVLRRGFGLRCAAGASPFARRLRRHEGRDGPADPTRKAAMTTKPRRRFRAAPAIPDRPGPPRLQLYGYRPFNDEPDPSRFPKRTSSPASISTSSTPSWWRLLTLASNPTLRTCSGRR